MTPYEEGRAAAQAGKTLQESPYAYSRVDPPIDITEYIARGMQHKNNEWMRGWRSHDPWRII